MQQVVLLQSGYGPNNCQDQRKAKGYVWFSYIMQVATSCDTRFSF